MYLVSSQQAAYHLYHHMFTDTFYMLTMHYKTFSRNALSLSNNDLCKSIFVVHRDFADVNFREIDICEINWYNDSFYLSGIHTRKETQKEDRCLFFDFRKMLVFSKEPKCILYINKSLKKV